jgi:hypothetical protein
MSYAVYDSTGYKGDFASGGGLKELRQYAEKTKNDPLVRFLDQGHAEPATLVRAIALGNDDSVNSTLSNLRILALKCQDVVIINNGIEEEEA